MPKGWLPANVQDALLHTTEGFAGRRAVIAFEEFWPDVKKVVVHKHDESKNTRFRNTRESGGLAKSVGLLMMRNGIPPSSQSCFRTTQGSLYSFSNLFSNLHVGASEARVSWKGRLH